MVRIINGKFYISPSANFLMIKIRVQCHRTMNVICQMFLFQEEEETLCIKKQQSLRSLIRLAKRICSQDPVRLAEKERGNPGAEAENSYSYVSMIFDDCAAKDPDSAFPDVSKADQVSLSEDYVEMN